MLSSTHAHTTTHVLRSLQRVELQEGKAHGGVGVATDAAIHHRPTRRKETRQVLFSDLQPVSVQGALAVRQACNNALPSYCLTVNLKYWTAAGGLQPQGVLPH